MQEHCQKFLSSFVAVRGSYADAAEALGEDWIAAIRNELGFDFNIDIDYYFYILIHFWLNLIHCKM